MLKMLKRIHILFCPVFVCLLLFCSVYSISFAAETLIVPDEYSTINEAVSNSNSGDIIKIKTGEYIIDELILLPHPLVFEGEGADLTELRAGSAIIGQQLIRAERISGGTSISGIHFIDGSVGARECNRINIFRNLFENPSGNGINLDDKWSCGSSTAYITNNTIINCQTGIHTNDWRNLYMYDNLIFDCATGLHDYDICHVYAEYNNFYSCDTVWDGWSTLPANNFSFDPLIEIHDDINGYLSEGSPCIDAGHPDAIYNDPDGSRNDIGVFPLSFDNNTPPIADAGSDRTGYVGENTCVTGVGTDGDGDELTYIWSSETIELIETSVTGQVCINTGTPGEYELKLVVFDGADYSDPDYVTVTSTTHEDEAIAALYTASTEIGQIPTSSFQNKNNGKTLQNKIKAAIDLIESGNIKEAYDQLTNDILKRTDGCSYSGSPDKGDWINNCYDQEVIYEFLLETKQQLEKVVIDSGFTEFTLQQDSWPIRNTDGDCLGITLVEIGWFIGYQNEIYSQRLREAQKNDDPELNSPKYIKWLSIISFLQVINGIMEPEDNIVEAKSIINSMEPAILSLEWNNGGFWDHNHAMTVYGYK